MPTEWEIQEVADFDGDGNPDLVWRNLTTQETAIWLMDGVTPTDYVDLGSIEADWNVSGVADFDLNGHADILWSNQTTGESGIWLIEQTMVVDVVMLPTVSTDLYIAGVADFNQDGNADIMWRNAVTGNNFTSYLNGTSPASYEPSIPVNNPDWMLTV